MAQQKKDYYEVLGVKRDATAADLKKAYHKAALEFHPDRQQGKSEAERKQAEERFKEAAEAYEVLSDPDKRAKYDQFGHAAFDDGAGGGYHFTGNINDILRQFFGGGFGGFGGFDGFDDYGGGRRQAKGKDLLVHLRLSLAEIMTGTERKLKIPRHHSCHACRGTGAKDGTALETCPTCHGHGVETRVVRTMLGMMQQQSTCHTCGGTGKRIKVKCPVCGGSGLSRDEEVVTVKIPAGVRNGMQVPKQGYGDEPRGGGIPGDLYVEIEEAPDANLRRVEDDLVYNLMIDIATATLGGKVEVPGVNSKLLVTIEPGTQPGTVLRLKNKGLPHLQSYGNGDMVINVMVYIPQSLDSDERRAVETLGRGSHAKPSESVKNGLFARLRHIFGN